jgi:hypothetical protein
MVYGANFRLVQHHLSSLTRLNALWPRTGQKQTQTKIFISPEVELLLSKAA